MRVSPFRVERCGGALRVVSLTWSMVPLKACPDSRPRERGREGNRPATAPGIAELYFMTLQQRDWITCIWREPLTMHGCWSSARLSGTLASLPTQNFHSPLGAWWWALCAHDESTPSTGVVDQTRRKRADLTRHLASSLGACLKIPSCGPRAPLVRRRRSSGGVRVIQVPHSSVDLCGRAHWEPLDPPWTSLESCGNPLRTFSGNPQSP